MRDVNTSKRNRKKSLILQGIKPHRAKSAWFMETRKKVKISS